MKKFLAIILSLALCLTVSVSCFAATVADRYTVFSDNDGYLEKGDSGILAEVFQYLLRTLGHYVGSVDGLFGNDTENAIKAWQTAQGQKPTGRINVDNLIGEIDPNAWIDFVTSGNPGIPEGRAHDIIAELLKENAIDDDYLMDFVATLALAEELGREAPNESIIVSLLKALLVYNINPIGKHYEYDYEAMLALIDELIDEDSEYYQPTQDFIKHLDVFRERLEKNDFSIFQDFLMEELLDNDIITDVDILLRIVDLLGQDDVDYDELSLGFIILAACDYLETGSLQDIGTVMDYARILMPEEEFSALLEQFTSLISFLADSKNEDKNFPLIRDLIYEFLNKSNVE